MAAGVQHVLLGGDERRVVVSPDPDDRPLSTVRPSTCHAYEIHTPWRLDSTLVWKCTGGMRQPPAPACPGPPLNLMSRMLTLAETGFLVR